MQPEEFERTGAWRSPRYDAESFEALVTQALDGLPEDIRAWLDNVAIVVADHPTAEHLRQGRVRGGGLLLGLYVGVPKTHRGVTYGEVLPDKIVIFQRSIERMCNTDEEIREQVRRTVLHEIGHHFGMDEGDLRDAGV
jgi:predicted Zn-dependent protease with MMP-like domain